jgi:hypothetical protein
VAALQWRELVGTCHPGQTGKAADKPVIPIVTLANQHQSFIHETAAVAERRPTICEA